MKTRTTALAAGMALVLSTAAHADYINDYVQLELGIGVAHYATPDGRWQQEGIPGGSKVTSKPPSFSVGLTGPLITRGAWGIDWHAGYVNLGRAAADCSCTTDDANYNANSHTYTPNAGAKTAYFTGYGRSQGAALTLETYYWTHGVRLGVEAGAYIHRDSWSETIEGWQVAGSGAPQNLYLSDAYWSVAPVVGASVGNGRFTLSYRHYFMGINSRTRNVPPLWNDADVAEIKIKF